MDQEKIGKFILELRQEKKHDTIGISKQITNIR